MEQLLHRTAASFSPFGGCLIINISISHESTYYASSLGISLLRTTPIVISLGSFSDRAGWGQAGSKLQHQRAQKMHFVTHEAHRQGTRVYRVDIDFRNAFNTMSQAALWHLMNMFHTPDVDLLEQIYDSATVPSGSKRRRKCNNHI